MASPFAGFPFNCCAWSSPLSLLRLRLISIFEPRPQLAARWHGLAVARCWRCWRWQRYPGCWHVRFCHVAAMGFPCSPNTFEIIWDCKYIYIYIILYISIYIYYIIYIYIYYVYITLYIYYIINIYIYIIFIICRNYWSMAYWILYDTAYFSSIFWETWARRNPKVAFRVFKNESWDDERPWSIQKPSGQLI